MTQTILVVEDHPTLREQIALNLDVQGYEVLESPTGIDSLSLLADKGRQIDLILLDLGLPEMDGFEVLSRLKADPVLFCPSETQWALQVSDTGPGISEEAQALVFDPFRQLDGSITRRHGGSGLGLSIVKKLSELMGGEVFIDSEEGRGSTFTVVLPLKPTLEMA